MYDRSESEVIVADVLEPYQRPDIDRAAFAELSETVTDAFFASLTDYMTERKIPGDIAPGELEIFQRDLAALAARFIVPNTWTPEPEPEPDLPAVGTRVVCLASLDRFPHFLVQPGDTGTVTAHHPDGTLEITIDRYLGPGAAEWENAVVLTDSDTDTANGTVADTFAHYFAALRG